MKLGLPEAAALPQAGLFHLRVQVLGLVPSGCNLLGLEPTRLLAH